MTDPSSIAAWGGDMSDLRCVRCGTGRVERSFEDRGEGTVSGLQCDACGALYDIVDGVPFLGSFDREDILGLIEVVATGQMNQTPIDLAFTRHIHTLLRQYHQSSDKSEFLRTHPDDLVRAPWFAEHRYHEWMQVDALLHGRPLAGRKVLNVGAGFGFDSVPLVDAGAVVTCIDYAPTIVGVGRLGLPGARWVGGFSHALPFADESFDIVCSNAALHHMRSTPLALREMLRVLKTGGYLFTSGDPIRPDSTDDSLEFQVFDRHEGVLSGVNEGIIRFGDIYDTLAEYAEHLDLAFIASLPADISLDGASPIGNGAFNDYWVPVWSQNVAALREMPGAGLCIAVTKRCSLPIVPQRQEECLLSARELADWVGDPVSAFPKLMAYASESIVDLPFPGEKQDWFSLLNGWMAPQAPFVSRTGYRRARWVLNVGGGKLRFSARLYHGVRELSVIVDGREVARETLETDWRTIEIEFHAKAVGRRVLVELRLLDDFEGATFDSACFEVRDRHIG